MRTLRYLSLLGLFASVGAALAVGLAMSTLPPAGTAAPAEKTPPLAVSVPVAIPAASRDQASNRQEKPARPVAKESSAPQVNVTRLPPVATPVPLAVASPAPAEKAEVAATPKQPADWLRRPAETAPAASESRRSEPVPVVSSRTSRERIVVTPSTAREEQSPAKTEPAPQPQVLELKLVAEPQKSPSTAPAAPVPLVASPDPPIAQRVPDRDTAEALQKVYKNLVGPLTNSALAPLPETIPPPPPGADPNRERPAPASAASQGPAIQVDQKTAEGDGRLRIQFPETDIREVLESLAEYGNLNILTSRSVQGKLSVRLRNVSVDEALEGVVKQAGYVMKREGSFVYVGNPQEIDAMQQTYGQIKTRVYRPNYVSATELQTLITPMATKDIGIVTKSSPTKAAQTGGSGAGGGSGGGSTGGSSGGVTLGDGDEYAGEEVIVVRDYEVVLQQIDQLVSEIDVRPMQVAIEAMILSVKLNDTDKLGVNFKILQQNHPDLAINIGTKAAFQGSGALSVAFTDSNLSAFLDALQETNATNVIATPRLMVLNKQQAEIHIGREQGYTSSVVQQTGGMSTATVAQMDTGTLLRLRPFVSSDGLIRMNVHPELSSGDVVEKASLLVPDKEITQVTTNIMVRDGCTVIIGGLMREQLTNNVARIAFLGGLPMVGALFRNTIETTERQEILVLITPHIVYEPETCREGEQQACEFHRRQAVVAEKMCPLGTRALGRRYFRLAQNAWAAGDRETAIRYVELAVHFDPQNRAAIDLRSNIWQGQPYGKFSLQQPPRNAAANPLDGPQIAGWLMDDLQREPKVQPAPQHPLDPGRPGGHRDIERTKVRQ